MRAWLSLSLVSSWLLVLGCAVSPQDVDSFRFGPPGLSAALSTRSGASVLPRFSRISSIASPSTVDATQGPEDDKIPASPLIKVRKCRSF